METPKNEKQKEYGIRRFIGHFWPYIRKQRALIAGSTLALMAEAGLRLLEPWPLKFVFDRVIPATPSGGTSGILLIDSLTPIALLTFSAFAVIAIIGLRAIASYGNTVGFALVGNRVLTEVRNDLFRHLHHLSLSFHTRSKGGELIVRVVDDINVLKDVSVTALMPLMVNSFILLGMLVMMLWLNWRLALVALIVFPLFCIVMLRLSRRIQKVSRKQRKRAGSMAATAAESFSAIKTVQALSLAGTFNQAFLDQSKKDLEYGVKARILASSLERTVDVIIAISTAMVLWYGATLVMQAILTPGDLLVFLAYLKEVFRPLKDTAKYTSRIAKATAAAERVVDIMETEAEIRDMPGAVIAPAFQGTVRFDSVDFGYEPGHRILKNIDLEVRPGQYVAILGPSGTGKSTLISLMLRLYDPERGSVMIDGRDIREYTIESLRQQISVLLQDNILFATSVRENIAYGANGVTPEEIEDVARLANAHEFIKALPQGYDTVLGERGVTLSNGQRQRIAIARAAIRRAAILILDEPTTGLDKENEQSVVEALERLAKCSTTFLLTHDMQFASHADLIIYIEEGSVVEQGTHEGLMKANGRYSAMFRRQLIENEIESKKEECNAHTS